MNGIVSYRPAGPCVLPCTRTGGEACTCCAKKKSRSKRSHSKRVLKQGRVLENRGDSQEPPPQPERACEHQDAPTVNSLAATPNVGTAGSQQNRELKRQDAFNERTLASEMSEISTAKKETAQLEREKVLEVCQVTSLGMAVIGVLASFLTPALLQKAGSGIQSISQDSLLHLPSAVDFAVAVAAGCGITAARFVAMQNWEDLAQSVNASNCRVLRTKPEMQAADVAQIACLPAVSEEILFRGAVVGNLGGGTGAVALVALLFGYLHVSGGRNYASGIFAGIAGLVYGMVFVYSSSVLAAAVAHSVGNVSSAAVWLASSSKDDPTQQS